MQRLQAKINNNISGSQKTPEWINKKSIQDFIFGEQLQTHPYTLCSAHCRIINITHQFPKSALSCIPY